MTNWDMECEFHINKALERQDPADVVASAVSDLIEAKVTQALYNCNVGGMPNYDPAQSVDYYEKLLKAALLRLPKSRQDFPKAKGIGEMSEIDIGSTEFRRLVKWRMYQQFGGLTPAVTESDLVDAAASTDVRMAMISHMKTLQKRISEINDFIHEAAFIESSASGEAQSRQDFPKGK